MFGLRKTICHCISINVLTVLLLASFSGNVQDDDIELKIYSCESNAICIIRGGVLKYPNPEFNPDNPKEYDFEIRLNESDMDSLQLLISDFLKVPENEVLVNYCLRGGFNYKLKLEEKSKFLKKVFIGNYYDARFNGLALIVNKYLSEANTEFDIQLTAFRDQSLINDFVQEQNKCEEASEEIKESLLNQWCEF